MTAPVPHLSSPVFVAGNSRALSCLRQALSGRCRWFVSHLPIEGLASLELLGRCRTQALWLSAWAVAHAGEVIRRLQGAAFVVIDDAAVPDSSEARCLRLSTADLLTAPEAAVDRLVGFISAAHSPPAS